MGWKILGVVFVSVFIAEMGDKTRLATMLFASDKEVTNGRSSSARRWLWSPLPVSVCWPAACCRNYINEKHLHYAAGAGFVIIGLGALWKA